MSARLSLGAAADALEIYNERAGEALYDPDAEINRDDDDDED